MTKRWLWPFLVKEGNANSGWRAEDGHVPGCCGGDARLVGYPFLSDGRVEIRQYEELINIENGLGPVWGVVNVSDQVRRDAGRLADAIRNLDFDTASKIERKYDSELGKGDVQGGPGDLGSRGSRLKAGDAAKRALAQTAISFRLRGKVAKGGDGSGWFGLDAPPGKLDTHVLGSQGGQVTQSPVRSQPDMLNPKFNKAKIVEQKRLCESGSKEGAVRAYKVSYEDDGSGVFKSMRIDETESNGPSGSLHRGECEVAAYDLAESFGFHIVPRTEYGQDGSGDAGTTQWHLGTGSRDGKGVNPKREERDDMGRAAVADMARMDTDNPERIEQTLALDIIMGNADRHYKNFMVDDAGVFWAIDHGHTGWSRLGGSTQATVKNLLHYSPLRAAVTMGQSGRKIGWVPSDSLRRSLQGITQEGFRKTMSSHLGKSEESPLTEQDVDAAWERLVYIRDHDFIGTFDYAH